MKEAEWGSFKFQEDNVSHLDLSRQITVAGSLDGKLNNPRVLNLQSAPLGKDRRSSKDSSLQYSSVVRREAVCLEEDGCVENLEQMPVVLHAR